MKLWTKVWTAALVLASVGAMAGAEEISYFTGTVTTSNFTEQGRASRSGTPQSWTGQESYTGQLNLTTTYYYKVYDFGASLFVGAPYVEVSVFDENNATSFFVSAFSGTYNPGNPGLNWLGDEGGSGNLVFNTGTLGDARYFDVTLPVGQDLILLVNSTLGGTNGLNQPFDIDVSAYADTSYDDPAVNAALAPEPGTLVMTFTGLMGAVGMARRRMRRV